MKTNQEGRAERSGKRERDKSEGDRGNGTYRKEDGLKYMKRGLLIAKGHNCSFRSYLLDPHGAFQL